MDTKTIIADAKARFSHNSTKAYLKDKYDSKLIFAAQDGLWKADSQTISLLSALTGSTVVLIDTFGNPVLVNRVNLLDVLIERYESVMLEWYNEWKAVEYNR